MKRTKADWAWMALRIGLGAVFVAASAYKIASPADFAHQINNYRILPPWAINPAAIVIPWLQLICGLALIANRMTRGASVLIVLMMAAFQVAVASALIRGLNVSCGCFRAGGSAATWWTFGRDGLILLAAAIQLVRSWPCQARESGHGAR